MLARWCTACLALASFATEIQPVFPEKGAKPAGPYTPGLLSNGFLYVAGQGTSGAAGADIAQQTRACLNNVKAIVEGAGLTMADVVYAHLYLTDLANYDAVNRVWPEFFPNLPARATAGVAAIPAGAPIEITVVAHKGANRSLKLEGIKNPVPISQGVFAGDKFYIAGILGRDSNLGVVPDAPKDQVATMFSRLKMVLNAAKLSPDQVAFVNVYRTAKVSPELLEQAIAKFWPKQRPAMAIVEVPALPMGTNVSVTGVAAMEAKTISRQDGCVAIGNTHYCSIFGSDGGITEVQTKTTLDNLRLDSIVATTVYLDDITEFAKMNGAYAKAFGDKLPLPTRTTYQPNASGAKEKFRFSYIAIR